MLKTTGARLKAVRVNLGLNQAKLAELFGLKGNNASISTMEKRDAAVKPKYLEILKERYDVNPSYVQMGDGTMFLSGGEVGEPSVGYGRIDLSESGVRARFQEQVNDYQSKQGLSFRNEVAERWHLNEHHLNGVMNDLKEITLPMLLKAHEFGKLNLNYSASGTGGYYVGSECVQHEKRIRELEDIVHVLRENIELKEHKRGKRSG